MLITYANTKIEKLCNDPKKYGIKEGLPKKIIVELEIALMTMRNMDSCQDFFKPVHMSYRFEKLTNKKGLMSIRLDHKYRLTFYEMNHEENLEFIEIKGIEIEKVSNHYGD